MTRKTHDNSVAHRGLVPSAQLGTGGTGGGTKFLADDQTFKTPAGGGGGGGSQKSAKMHLSTFGTTVATGDPDAKIPVGDVVDWDDWTGMVSGDDFVVPTGEAGKFRIEARAYFLSSGATPTYAWFELSIRPTGGGSYFDIVNVLFDELAVAGEGHPHAFAVLDLADGDTISLWAANFTDGDLSVNNGALGAWLAITKLS